MNLSSFSFQEHQNKIWMNNNSFRETNNLTEYEKKKMYPWHDYQYVELKGLYYLSTLPICGHKAVGSFLFVWSSTSTHIFGIFEPETVFWLSATLGGEEQYLKLKKLRIINKELIWKLQDILILLSFKLYYSMLNNSKLYSI